jgi:eukaryotic-like serine/threonine-protein kinase
VTPERWRRIQEVFGEASELAPGAGREAYLDRACAGDAGLRARVAEMLALDESSSPLLDAAPAELAEALRPPAPGGYAGRTVGPYRIVREIGRGGMGTVYLAEREDVGKRVALKVVRGGLAAPENVERFLRERRVLARLEHPHVARLLDAGKTEDGTPYFAMELVEGEPIDVYCDTRRLPLSARLALFAQVCEAVRYAHRSLVVHRDLKPSNVLVTRQGAVKLLDFGIARVLEDDGDAEGHTRPGARLLTPEYAAPEQVLGEPVTTATDVYALGVVLYELLTGHRPYAAAGRSWGEVEAEVLTAVPARPSSAVARPREPTGPGGAPRRLDPGELAAARGTTPAGLRRALRGDLDTLVLKALEKEPARRYDSAEHLLADLERYRKGLPLSVRPATWRYRAAKFARRHRTGVIGAAAFAVLAAGSAAVVGTQQARARLEAERAQRAADFLGQLFATSDPKQARGRLIATPALLEWGERRLDALDGHPEAQAQVLARIGEAYVGLGGYRRAAPLFERALGLRRAVHRGDHRDVAESLWWLAVVRVDQADFDGSERLFRESLAMRRRLFGDEHAEVAKGYTGVGFVRMSRGDARGAEAAFRRAAAIVARDGGAPWRSIPHPRNGLANALVEQGRYVEAEPHAREALAGARAEQGEDHPFVVIALANLARALHGKGEAAEAEALFREAIAKAHRVQGEDHPRLAVYLGWYAGLLADRGDTAQAEAAYRRSLGVQRRGLPPEHVFLVPTLVGLGELLTASGRPREAEALLREAAAIGERRLPPAHPHLAQAQSELGACLAALGRVAEAAPLLAAGHAALRETLGEAHPLTRRARERLDGRVPGASLEGRAAAH